MAEEEHWSDEDYGDGDLLDDWEAIAEADEEAEKETAEQEEAKKRVQEMKQAKRAAARRRRLKVEERDATELSAALSSAHAELLSRAQNKSAAADLVNEGKRFRGPETLNGEEDVTNLVSGSAEVIEEFKTSENYPHYIVCLAEELVQHMKQADLVKLRDHVAALKVETVKQRKAAKAARKHKEEGGVADRDTLGDVDDRAGGEPVVKKDEYVRNEVPDEDNFM